jgi:uncharacterized peroxidase-related enzyme
MTFTRAVSPDDPGAPAIYATIRSASTRGAISNLWQTLAVDPAGLDVVFAHFDVLMGEPAPLTASQAELIALVVSATNGCSYCVAHHGPRLARALGDEPLARAVARDYREADLRAQDRVLLDFAVALTCEPAERKREDVDRMREYGFDDAAIVRATEVVAFYNGVNRIVCGLGVAIEAGLEPWEYGAQK